MSFEQTIESLHHELAGCLVLSYVDVSTGMALGTACSKAQAQQRLDLFAAAAAEVLGSEGSGGLELVFRQQEGGASEPFVPQETYVYSRDFLHVFLRSKRHPSHALCAVMAAHVNLGMSIMKIRAAMSILENTLP